MTSKRRTTVWLDEETDPRIEKALKKLNKDSVQPWETSSFIRLCINEKLQKMGIK